MADSTPELDVKPAVAEAMAYAHIGLTPPGKDPSAALSGVEGVTYGALLTNHYRVRVFKIGAETVIMAKSTSAQTAANFEGNLKNAAGETAATVTCGPAMVFHWDGTKFVTNVDGLEADHLQIHVSHCMVTDGMMHGADAATFACALEIIQNFSNMGCGNAVASWNHGAVKAEAYGDLDDAESVSSDVYATTELTLPTIMSRYIPA